MPTLDAGVSAARTLSSTPNVVRYMSAVPSHNPTMSRMDPIPESMKGSMMVSSLKEELKRRQRVSTTYFDFPISEFSGEER